MVTAQQKRTQKNRKKTKLTKSKKVVLKKISIKKKPRASTTRKTRESQSARFLVVANWKMNPVTLSEAKALFLTIKDKSRVFKETKLVICPPSIYFDSVKGRYSGKKILFGAQTCFIETHGSFTGEISAEMIKSAGGEYVILGHSERRKMGETDSDVRARVEKALEANLTPIVCVGEQARDSDGEYLSVIKEQLHALFYGMSHDWLGQIIIAYEPIWAIGKSGKEAVTPHALHETAIYIRKVLSELFDKRLAIEQRILYGGSVEPENAEDLIDGTQVEGFLVGHASLNANEFIKIAEAVENYAKR